MDGGHNTKGPRQIGPSVEEIFRFLSIFTTGGMYFWGFRGQAKQLGGAEASYAVSGGGGPNGVCGSSGVPLVRAGRRCGHADRQTDRQTAFRRYDGDDERFIFESQNLAFCLKSLILTTDQSTPVSDLTFDISNSNYVIPILEAFDNSNNLTCLALSPSDFVGQLIDSINLPGYNFTPFDISYTQYFYTVYSNPVYCSNLTHCTVLIN